MNELNVRQKLFAKKIIEGKNGGQAYAEAYDREVDETAYNNASRLLADARIKETIAQRLEGLEQNALDVLTHDLNDKKTPAAVRTKIAQDILDRRGHSAAQKVDIKDERVFPGLNDQEGFNSLVLEAAQRIADEQG